MPETLPQQVDSAVEQLRQQLADWRQIHRPPTPIPAEIWASAVELAQKHGLSYTVRALGLGYNSLKQRLVSQECPGPTFLEWFAPVSDVVAECRIVVESDRGPKVHVEVKNVSPQWLSSMLRELVA